MTRTPLRPCTGPCPASEGRRSATSVLLPCKHDIHYSYEAAAAMILGNECPVCYRLGACPLCHTHECRPLS